MSRVPSIYRAWFWIDHDVRNHAKDIEELELPKEQYIQVPANGAGPLKELREGLEKLRYDEVVKLLTARV